jgi:TRAP-type C4-dicarboxylate transport system permease small subunit
LHELAILGVIVAVVMTTATVATALMGPALRLLEYVLLCGSIVAILFVTAFVCAEVLMRYVFNSPIPGHLEGSELLVPVIVFLAMSHTQATHGHVGMDMLLDALAPSARRYATIGTLLISILVCAVLAYFSAKNAYQLWTYDDVTMTPPYMPTWPAAAAIPLGYGLVSIRMYLQVLHLFDPRRFPAHAPGDPVHLGASDRPDATS